MMTSPHSPITQKRYNILLLGETQAGKSTFVQAVKRFANPNHIIETDTIGNGNNSKTMAIAEHAISTRYPSHEAFDPSATPDAKGHEPIAYDMNSLLEKNIADWEDFKDSLDVRNLEVRRYEDPGDPAHYIYLYDTPGLNDTEGDDERHIATILRAVQSMQEVHLVLVMIGTNAFTPGVRDALQSYMDVFPEFQGLITFIHTKFDYVNLHPQREKEAHGFEERKNILHTIMGRDSCNHHVLDCDLGSRRPVRYCMTQNTIRRILREASTNVPVSFHSGMVHKTKKMLMVDKIIINKHSRLLTAATETLNTKNVQQGHIMERIIELDSHVNNLRVELNTARDFLQEHDTDADEFFDECAFEQKWKWMSTTSTFTWMALHPQKYIIRKYTKMNDHFYITKVRGGVQSTFCEFQLSRHAFKKGRLHVKFYTTSAEKYKNEIAAAHRTQTAAINGLMKAIDQRQEYKDSNSQIILTTKPLLERNHQCTCMIAKAQETTIELSRFLVDAENKMYSGELAVVAEMVEARYSLSIQSPHFQRRFMSVEE